MNSLSKKAKGKAYFQSVGFILLGIVLCTITGFSVSTGQDIELGRHLPTTHGVFLLGILLSLGGLFKAALTLMAFTKEEKPNKSFKQDK
jgi:hypothetical protein